MNTNHRLKITLTDDQALEIMAQIGTILAPKQKQLEPSTLRYTPRKYKQKGPLRQVKSLNGKLTVSSQVYDLIVKSTSGAVLHFKEINEKCNTQGKSASSVWSALKKLETWKRIRRVGKGAYQVI